MLSIGKMRPEQAASYFEQDNYYQQKKSVDASEWIGEGAEELGLSGPVDPKDFEQICYGNTPDGRQLRLDARNGEAVAGIDCTFSAPKSVSLAALVGGDDRLIAAHNAAAKAACKVIEERYVWTRVKGDRIQAKPVIAMFEHDTSRELDPQLHTHCFFANLVRTADGKWQSLANEHIYDYKMLLGQVYRNELARNVEALGYRIEHRADGLFEIEGYSREQILEFSKRHNQILKRLEALGLPDTAENRINALFATRKAKQKNVDCEALKQNWRQSALSAGITHPIAGEPIHRPQDLEKLVTQAIAHCQEKRSVFKLEAVERYITAQPTGHTIEAIDKAIPNYPGILYKEGHYATAESLERERETVALMQVSQRKYSRLGTVGPSEGLTAAQSDAVETALRSRDGVIGWCGVAGAGKTHTVKSLMSCLDAEPIGLAPDASAALTLGEETGMKVSTVAQFMASDSSHTGKLLIIDEAGKLSAKDAHALLERSVRDGFRLLLIGDPKQLSAVDAGSPFRSLLKNGMSTAMLHDFLRQKNTDLNVAVQYLYNDWGKEALSILDDKGWITEYKNFDERVRVIADKWIKGDRPNTRIIAGTHKEREAITGLLRTQLKSEGHIEAQDHTLKSLRGKDLSNEQIQHAHNYGVGDVIIPQRDRHGLKRSKQYVVGSVQGDRLMLVSGNGVIHLDMSELAKPLEARVYERSEIGVAVGDRLRWTQNCHKLSRINGAECSVAAIEGDIVRVEYDNGKQDQFSLNQCQHIDYGLVRTIYSSQGMTVSNVIVGIGNDATTTKEAMLVAITRAKHKAEIVCSSRAMIENRIEVSDTQPNVMEWLRDEYKIKPVPMPQFIDTSDLRTKFAELPLPQKIDPLIAAARETFSKRYLELSAKLSKPGLELAQLDTAIALASGKDAAKVLYFSPKNQSAQPQEIERYLKQILQQARAERQAIAVKGPRVR